MLAWQCQKAPPRRILWGNEGKASLPLMFTPARLAVGLEPLSVPVSPLVKGETQAPIRFYRKIGSPAGHARARPFGRQNYRAERTKDLRKNQVSRQRAGVIPIEGRFILRFTISNTRREPLTPTLSHSMEREKLLQHLSSNRATDSVKNLLLSQKHLVRADQEIDLVRADQEIGAPDSRASFITKDLAFPCANSWSARRCARFLKSFLRRRACRAVADRWGAWAIW